MDGWTKGVREIAKHLTYKVRQILGITHQMAEELWLGVGIIIIILQQLYKGDNVSVLFTACCTVQTGEKGFGEGSVTKAREAEQPSR